MTNSIEQDFCAAQQALVDGFKDSLREAADDVLSKLYTDVSNYAATDAHTNYHNHLRDEFKASMTKEICEEFSFYSWAHGIRMELLSKHADKISNKIIEDLQDKIKSLNEHIDQLRSMR